VLTINRWRINLSNVSSVGFRTVPHETAESGGYIVKAGDTLTEIAAEHGVSLAALEAANPQVHNPDLIRPGEHINIPAGANQHQNASSYTVHAGDTLSGIGERFGLDWHVLAQINHLRNPNLILTGQTLKLRADSSGTHGSQSGSPVPSDPSAGPTPTSGKTPASQQGRINDAMRYFESQGWTRAQAAGIVANLQAESGLDPGIQQHGGGPGYGLGQWEGPRQAAFARWAGHDIHGSSFNEQLRFVQYELTHSEAGAGNALRGATSASDAAAIVTRLYERPADIVGQSQYRAGLARQIFASSAP
jgi:LysM repeat protein